MSHLKKIMLLKENDLDTVVFIQTKREGGINVIFDPDKNQEVFQVFIQQSFPLREVSSWEFENFREARNFAASNFKDWEMLIWNHGVNRPCGNGGGCSSGSCGSKNKNADPNAPAEKSSCGGGCTSCGATKEFDELLQEDELVV